MPVSYRQWFINRLVREIEEKEAGNQTNPNENMADNFRNLDNFEKSLGVNK